MRALLNTQNLKGRRCASLGVLFSYCGKEMLKPIADGRKCFLIGQVNDSEVSGVIQVKAAAVGYKYLFLAQEIKCKLLVALDVIHIQVEFGEYVECRMRLYTAYTGNSGKAVVNVISLHKDSPARH